jgi:hypothetical protein
LFAQKSYEIENLEKYIKSKIFEYFFRNNTFNQLYVNEEGAFVVTLIKDFFE